ncbi:MAG: alpha/beta fold hydrolase, partial [Pseudomonadota bacterium]
GMDCRVTWDAMLPTFAARFRVARYDLLGHGESALPGAPVDLAALARQVLALMDTLGWDRAALVGFSLGGMINRRVALDAPGRVNALAILNSPHDRGAAAQAEVEARARASAAGGPGARIDETLARWFTADFRARHADRVETVRQVVLANDPENYAAHRYVLAQGVRELIRPAPPITQPTLVMTCEGDTGSTPAMAHAIGAEIAGAAVEVVPGLQHLGLIERPDAFAWPVAAFLNAALAQERTQ